MTQNTTKLEKLIEFAKKGGIGTCVASRDIIAESETELMFCTGEIITVLKHIKDDIYLGYCEGVVGIFRGNTVKFNGILKNPKSIRSGKRSPTSSTNSSDQDSPKQSFLIPSSERSSSSSLGLPDIENYSQSGPAIKIIDTSENIHNDNSFPLIINQNKVPMIIPSQRKSSISSDHSIPISPRKHSTMPQLSSSPTSSSDPVPMLQRRNNTVPIIAISRENSINFNAKLNHINSSSPIVVSNDKTINPQASLIHSDPDQIITDNKQLNMKNVPPRGSSLNEPNGFQSSEISNDQAPHLVESSSPQIIEHVSTPNTDRSCDSPLNSSVSPKSYGLPSSPKFGQYNPSPLGSPSKVDGRDSPSQMQYPRQKYPTGFNEDHKSVIDHYSPSTTPLPTPLPSPKMPQLKVLQEENIVIDDRYSPSTTPLPSPHFNINRLRSYDESRITVSNTPVSTPVIVTPKITLEDDDIDDSDFDQEGGTLSSSNNNSMKSSSSSYNQPSSAKVFTLQVDHSKSDSTPEQLSANESEDVSSEDEDEIKVEKNEPESKETQETQPSKPAKKKKEPILAIDEFGFVYDVAEDDIPPGADRIQRIIQAPGAEEKTTRTIRLYREREAKWVAVLGSMDCIIARDSRKIKKMVRHGIPESVRGKAWQFMAHVDKYRKPHLFDELRNKQKLPIYDVIERDIHRCYPDHIQFREETGGLWQEDLHNILKAYAHYNPAVGYCQGMGRLVGMMLMQMPAEDTFWLLVATLEEYMAGYFNPTLSQVRIDSMVFEKLLAEHDPKLYQHLANNGVTPLMYMTQWFMTIFTMTLPWASVLRVWDIFYFEGVKLFFRIGLSILDCTKEHILKNCPTNSEILQFLLHIPHELLTPDLLLESAFKIRLKRSAIRKLTKKVIEENNEIGSDTTSISSSKENRRGLMKKSKSFDKLKVDGVEFKLIGE